MNILANLVLLIGLIVLLWHRLQTLLTYFQQEEYDEKRFIVSCARMRLFDIRATAATVVAIFIPALSLPAELASVVLALVFVGIACQERQYRFKKKLIMTNRARRLNGLAFSLVFLSAFAVFFHPIFAIAALQFPPLALVVANIMLKPAQERINYKFIAEARKKLHRLDPIRIGITGSFGKTTVKHMLAEILEASGPVFYSRGSINTILGLTRHIRQRLQWGHRYFIAEMGAYGIGSIKRLCNFVAPKYGIITAVGDAHTERFGSIEAIAQAKSELAEEICSVGGIVVLNSDILKYEPFQRLKDRFGSQCISVGTKGADVKIGSKETLNGSWSITLCSDDQRVPEVTYELPLLGEHNVLNSALAVTLAAILDRDIADQIPYFTKTIAQIPHRLQKLETLGSALILDDAYNSNEFGFMSAVALLNKLAKQRGGRRILVTPGIAELGLEHDNIHARLGAFCSDKCDVIYVVNPSRIRSFVEAIDPCHTEIFEVGTLAAAREAIANDLHDEDVVLYENDLPDILEEKRLL